MKQIALLLLFSLSATVFADTKVNWYQWSSAAFAKAKKDNKLIMVYVGHEGCTACRFMETRTFADPRVIDLLNEHFVTIQIDSVAEPDLGERYSDWAWPANAVLLPDTTQVTAFRGRTFPDRYVVLLNELLADFAKGKLKADPNTPYSVSNKPRTTDLALLRDRIRVRQDRRHASMKFGIFETAEPLRSLLLRYHTSGDEQALSSATRVLDGLLNHIDPVWGGMFYESVGNWSNILPEKRLENQIAALQAYAEAYQITGKVRYREAIQNVHRYLAEVMRSGQGTYFASTQDRLDKTPQKIDMRSYYKLNDKERRKHGMPTLDHAIYTDQNARVVTGYALAYSATNEKVYLDAAVTAMNALLATRQAEEGWMIQLIPGEELLSDERSLTFSAEPKMFLRTQAQMGMGLLSLYKVTNNSAYKEKAVELANLMLSKLENKTLGGFYGAADDGSPGRRKPLEDNAVAARFLYLLGVLTKQDAFKSSAERAIRASTPDIAVRREGRITGNLAMALETLTTGYVEFSIVGKSDNPASRALLQAGRDVFEPRKVIHFEAAGRYPKRDKPAMYICSDEACSVPIYKPEDVAKQAKQFTSRK